MNEPLLRQLQYAWGAIASHLGQHHPHLAPTQIRQSTHQFMLGILCLRLCEQYGLVAPGQWRTLGKSGQVYAGVGDRLQALNQRYGSLFPLQDWLSELEIEDAMLHQMLGKLENCWGKEEIPISILGQSHEGWISQPLAGTADTLVAKKRGGVYYTPSVIVEDILHRTVGELDNGYPQILDPTCGGGAFLLAAYQYLLDRVQQPTRRERERTLLECIYGVDIDPQAVEVTKLSLLLALLIGEREQAPSPVPDLSHNIQWGNALVCLDGHDPLPDRQTHVEYAKLHDRTIEKLQSRHHAAIPQSSDPLQVFTWKTAFAHILQTGGFDAVIGNPPYVDAEWMTTYLPHWRHYCTRHYQTATGNWDLFCVFIEKALELCKPGGFTSLVVPNKLASAGYAGKVRSLLTRHYRLHTLRDYSRTSLFPVAAVYPLVFVAQNCSADAQATVQYDVVTWDKEASQLRSHQSHTIPYSRYLIHPEQPWISVPLTQASLLDRLREGFLPLAQCAQVTGAATVAEAYALQSLIHNCEERAPGDLRLVNSGTIDRYCFRWGEKPLRYLGSRYLHPVMPRSLLHHLPVTRHQQATQPKIIVAGMSKILECGLDADGTVMAGKSTSVIRGAMDLRYLLGILNSRLIRFYFISTFGGNSLQGGYLRIGPPQLKQIPLYLPTSSYSADQFRHDQLIHDQLIELVDAMLLLQDSRRKCPEQEQSSLVDQLTAIDRQIDHTVYELYRLSDGEINTVNAFQP